MYFIRYWIIQPVRCLSKVVLDRQSTHYYDVIGVIIRYTSYMSEWVCESPLGVSTSNLSYPMFAVNWPRGHVNTRANKSMTTVSVIDDISDIVSISRGFMEYPHPLHMLWRHSLNSVPAHSKHYSITVSVPLYSYKCISKSYYRSHLWNI